MVHARLALAQLLLLQGRREEAFRHIELTLAACGTPADPRLSSAATRHRANRGNALRALGDHEAALADYDEALAALQAMRAEGFYHSVLIDSAESLFALGRLAEAADRNRRGLAYMRERGHEDHVAQAEALEERLTGHGD